ncbi:unnamed protein product [Phytophthora lilii]|uniref:Unnamed protein product n=1 Tax=Phytophthora lilii TaxID=2077276 RepID=A0A9W6X1P7_9STRA|nr:unnamed protein product [Phytophthora lilii]
MARTANSTKIDFEVTGGKQLDLVTQPTDFQVDPGITYWTGGKNSDPNRANQKSPSEILVDAKLQYTDFYRISEVGELTEFKELMDAKASVSSAFGEKTFDNGDGKHVLFIEIGDLDIPQKPRTRSRRS